MAAGIMYLTYKRKIKEWFPIILITLFFFSFINNPILAQTQSSQSMQQGMAAQYFVGSDDQLKMKVNIWGFVGQPGLYNVPYDTDLISLLSYAGGPLEEAKIKKIKVVRANPSTNSSEGEVIEVDVKRYLEKADQSIIPILKPGDTVLVSGTTFHFMSKFFSVTMQVMTFVQLYIMMDYYSSRH